MKWVLIVMTFWRPDVQMKTTEMKYAAYNRDADEPGFGYVLMCMEKAEWDRRGDD